MNRLAGHGAMGVVNHPTLLVHGLVQPLVGIELRIERRGILGMKGAAAQAESWQ